MGTLDIFKSRSVTGRTHTNYFSRWLLRAPSLIKRVLEIDRALSDKAVLEGNQYPMLRDLYPRPDFGIYHQSAFLARVITDDGEYLHVFRPDLGRRFAPLSKEYYKAPAAERIIAGEVGWEHAVGGKGTRMKLDMEKFLFDAHALIDNGREMGSLSEEQVRHYTGAIKEHADIPLGVRHMLAFACSLKRLADRYGEDWRDALWNQHVFMIANADVLDRMVETFKDWDFFGLDPDKVLFMVSESYPVLRADESGQISVDHDNYFIHNHGVARVQTTMDYSWFRYDPKDGERTYLSRDETVEIYKGLTSFQSMNVEDLDYLIEAIDIHAQILALGTRFRPLPSDFDLTEYRMMMEVVQQKKDNPQKGGMLAFDPNFFEPGTGRVVVVEAFELFPAYHHYDGAVAKKELYPKILWLNRNVNSYSRPGAPGGLLELITKQGLPFALGIKKGGLVNEMPQGAANYFLPTVYVARMKKVGDRYEAVPIRNLKEAGDIATALEYLLRQAQVEGFLDVLNAFRPR
jgi:hypothetical protein